MIINYLTRVYNMVLSYTILLLLYYYDKKYIFYKDLYIYIHIYVCVCVCMCVYMLTT